MSGGLRTSNLPLGTLIDVLGHADAGGGALALRRMPVGTFVNLLRGLASGDPSAVAGLSAQVQALYDGLETLKTDVRAFNAAAATADGALHEETGALRVRLNDTDASAISLRDAVRDLKTDVRAFSDAAATADGALHDEVAVLRNRINQTDASAIALLEDIRELAAAAERTDNALHEEANALRRELASLASNAANVGVLEGEIRDRVRANAEFLAVLAELRADLVQSRGDNLLATLSATLSGGRPGICPDAYTNVATGKVERAAPLDPRACLITPFGRAYRVGGAGLVAPRLPTIFDLDAIFVLQVRFWRLEDVLDPNNSAVDVGIQWLDPEDGDAGRTLLHRETSLRVQDGPITLTWRVPSLQDARPAISPPKAAVSWRPYLRCYGANGATCVEALHVRDATFAGVYAPDVSALAGQIRTLQAQIGAGLPFASPVLPSYAVQDLPRPGNPGRKAFASDGRAPNAAGALEAANAGSGVEVTDNGVKWVITGTNQQVQA